MSSFRNRSAPTLRRGPPASCHGSSPMPESLSFSPAWYLVYSTGMRRSKVLGTHWQNLDLESGRVAVVDTLVLLRNKPVFKTGETKLRRSRRVIALDSRTAAVLRQHRVRQNAERLRAGSAWNDQDLVFSDELGGVVHRTPSPGPRNGSP